MRNLKYQQKHFCNFQNLLKMNFIFFKLLPFSCLTKMEFSLENENGKYSITNEKRYWHFQSQILKFTFNVYV